MTALRLSDAQKQALRMADLHYIRRDRDAMATTAHQRAAMDALVNAVANAAPVMSIRDQFAASALNGLLASGQWSNATNDIEKHLANTAYNFADAMIEAAK